MNERMASVNRDLRILDDAHRLGQIGRSEYRLRRRNVLARLNESARTEPPQAPSPVRSGTTTATRPVSRVQPAGVPNGPMFAAAAMEPPSLGIRHFTSTWPGLALLGLVLVAVTVAITLGFHHPSAPGPRIGMEATTSPGSKAPDATADDLKSRMQNAVDADRWDMPTVQGLTEAWQHATPQMRADARTSAAYSALRDAVAHQRQVLSLLREGNDDDATRAQRALALDQLAAALNQ